VSYIDEVLEFGLVRKYFRVHELQHGLQEDLISDTANNKLDVKPFAREFGHVRHSARQQGLARKIV
jgi:hypothetical protein